MKINLPIFKDKDTKDAVSYQSWRWDLTVYCWAGCCKGPYPPPLCHLILARVSQRACEELQDGHNLG